MDPYKVLGVSPDASDEEIKKVYRTLVKKYHPDRYRNDPMAGMAEEKIREINAAYDKIQAIRAGKDTYNPASGDRPSGSYENTGDEYTGPEDFGNVKYGKILYFIKNGMIGRAYTALYMIPEKDRDAEWFFLAGIVNEQLGHYASAYNNYRTAANLDPSNPMFKHQADSFEQRARRYSEQAQSNSFGREYSSCARECCYCTPFCVSPCGGTILCC